MAAMAEPDDKPVSQSVKKDTKNALIIGVSLIACVAAGYVGKNIFYYVTQDACFRRVEAEQIAWWSNYGEGSLPTSAMELKLRGVEVYRKRRDDSFYKYMENEPFPTQKEICFPK